MIVPASRCYLCAVSSRPPPNGPYREADPQERRPPSPDIDPSVLASERTTPLLVLAAFWVPTWLLLTWLTQMQVQGCGPTHVETTAEKIGVTVVLTLVFAVLLAFRVRHSRRQSQALRMLRIGAEQASAQLGGSGEYARVRVDTSTATSGGVSESAEAPETAIASESAIALETRRRNE